MKWKSLSRAQLFATPWTAACQALLSMELSGQGSWSGLPFPSPGNLPDPGTEPRSPALQEDSLLTELLGKPADKRGSDSVSRGGTGNFHRGSNWWLGGSCQHSDHRYISVSWLVQNLEVMLGSGLLLHDDWNSTFPWFSWIHKYYGK